MRILCKSSIAEYSKQLAKMLRYLRKQLLCDLTFVAFLLSWFITRHVLFIIVIFSTIYDAPRFIPWKWSPEEEYWMTEGSYRGFISMLVSLQVSSFSFI
jgi:very-long-chain ceramide synthase